MNDDELKNLWRAQPAPNVPELPASGLTEKMRGKMSKWRRQILARDARELAACAIIIIGFGYYFFSIPTLVTRIGDIILIATAVFIGAKLVRTRKANPSAQPSASVIESLHAERNSVHSQAELLRTVVWWYLLPLFIGTLVFAWGTPGRELSWKINFSLGVMALHVVIFFSNQYALRKKLRPMIAQLDALIQGMETGQFDETLMQTQTIASITAEPAAPSRVKTVLINIAESTFAVLLCIAGLFAYDTGTFMNFVYVLLLLLAPISIVVFVFKAALGKIYFGIVLNPFSKQSRPYCVSTLARLIFFASCGYLLSIAVVPCQFPQHAPHYMQTVTWSLAALQIVLVLMPPRRISIPFIAMYCVGAFFMIWHFVQIAAPLKTETVILDSPLKGVACVVQGGKDAIINHHYLLQSQRDALDIFKVADTVQQIKDWKIMRDDAGFGATIYSPCSGRVAHVESNHRDNRKGQTDTEHVAGNYITIEISPNRYVLIAHLKRKSPTVKVGDEVKAGDPIAQCGNSGNTTMPHVHIQIQAAPDFNYGTQTFPIAFRHVLRGDKELENIQAKRNDLLLNTEN